MENEKETLENVIKFMDGVSKTLEGLKDKYSLLILEAEAKSDRPDATLQNWVTQSNLVIKEKFEEVFRIKCDNEFNLKEHLSQWINKYKENHEFILNTKVLLKNIQHIRSTIKTKLTASDSLSYINLTELMINKSKAPK